MSAALISHECEETISSSAFVTTEVALGVLLLVAIAFGVTYVRYKWKSWLEALIDKAFHSVDVDNSGEIQKDELWAGVLSLYITLRQQNIPADPPPREAVMKLLEDFDTNNDHKLSIDEFKQVVGALSVQALGRVITMVGFVSMWPLAVGLGYNAFSEACHQHGAPSWMPSSLVCLFMLIDDLHLPPTIGTILGFVLVVPPIIKVIDMLCACGTKATKPLKPLSEPLLGPLSPKRIRAAMNQCGVM